MALAGLDRRAQTPAAMALEDERRSFTWAELDQQLNRAINAMLAADVAPGARLAVMAPNSHENAIVIVAALQAGISSVPINYHLTAGEAAYMLQDSRTKLLFVGPESVESGLAAAASAGVKTVVGWRCEKRSGLVDWDEWLAAASDAEAPIDRLPQPHLQYTSGTTGRPKGVQTPPTMFPPGASATEFFELLVKRFEGVGSPSPVLIVGPMYHTGPMNWVRHLGAGASVVIQSWFDPEKLLEAVDRHRIEGMMLVPTHFRRLLALPDDVKARYRLDSLKYVTHTGSACPPEVKRAMIDWWGPVFLEAYGGTESGNITAIGSEEWLRKPGSVGKASAPYELVIIGDDDSELGPNEEGKIYARDKTGRGIVYHDDPEKTAAAHLSPGVFTLGEIGYVDEDGYLFITDRFSDMIVRGGVNIYPAEIEQVLMLHPDVADIAVIGAPDEEMGEEVRALIVPRDPVNPPDVEALLEFCRGRLAKYKCPNTVEFVADVKRNAIGKINKTELRRRYWNTAQRVG
jgi:long-chain acyl-CoA synthetase